MNHKAKVSITLLSLLSGSVWISIPAQAETCGPVNGICFPSKLGLETLRQSTPPTLLAQFQSLKLVLDAHNGEGNLYLYPNLQPSNPNHLWDFVSLGNGYYLIISKENGYALDANGTKGELYLNPKPNRWNLNHHWKLSEVGNYWMITSRVKGYALDANGGNGNLYLNSRPNRNNTNQLWKVIDVNRSKAIGSALAVENTGGSSQSSVLFPQSRSLNLVLDAHNGEGDIYLYPNLQPSNPNHLWDLVSVGNGYYLIVSKENGYALDANGAKGELYLNPKPNRWNLNHHWKLSEAGNYWMITSRVKGYALDANGGNGKLYLSPNPRRDNSNQLWKIVDVEGSRAIGSALKN